MYPPMPMQMSQDMSMMYNTAAQTVTATTTGNILCFTPPGFKQSLSVKFPDGRLPVCDKCKKNYKTRDSCRVRSGHTSAPWTTAYICITLDESCITPDGKYVQDVPFKVRMGGWAPYKLKNDFDLRTPVCSACKKTNRTRSFCRDRHKHRQLPWCTVFVVLYAEGSAGMRGTTPSNALTIKDDSEKEGEEETEAPTKEEAKEDVKEAKKEEKEEEEKEKSPEKKEPASDESKEEEKKDIKAEEVDDKKEEKSEESAKKPKSERDFSGEWWKNKGDDINDIDMDSRSFLVKISSKSCTIHWLDREEGDTRDPYPPSASAGTADGEAKGMESGGSGASMMDPNQYYGMNMWNQPQFFSQQQQYAMHQQQLAAWHAHYNQQMMQQYGSNAGGAGEASAVGDAKDEKGGDSGGGEDDKAASPTKTSRAPPESQMSPGGFNPNDPNNWHAQMMFQQQMYQQQMFAAQQHFMSHYQQPPSDDKKADKKGDNVASPKKRKTSDEKKTEEKETKRRSKRTKKEEKDDAKTAETTSL